MPVFYIKSRPYYVLELFLVEESILGGARVAIVPISFPIESPGQLRELAAAYLEAADYAEKWLADQAKKNEGK